MRPPTALSITGSDPSGADGLAVDLKTFSALGVYGAAAVTAVQAAPGAPALPVDGAVLRDQVVAVLDELPVDAVRIGLLPTAATASAVADLLDTRRDEFGHVVVDLVMLDDAGAPLATAEAVTANRERVLPRAHVLVAGPAEVAQLLGADVTDDAETMRDRALSLRALGIPTVVLRDGRLDDGRGAVVVAHEGGVDVLQGEEGAEAAVRGRGATLSAAIAAQYARIADFDRAGELGEIGGRGTADDDLTVVASAQEFVASAVAHARDWTLMRRGTQPVDHLITLAD